MTTAAPAASVLDTPDLAGYPTFLRPHVASDTAYYAGFWVRLGIHLVDLAVQLVAFLIVDAVGQLVAGIVGNVVHAGSDRVSLWTTIVCAVAVFVYYNVFYVGRRGRTLAMRFGALRVIADDASGDFANRATLLRRGAIFVLFTVLVPLRIVDAAYIVVDQRKRSLHDVMTGTAVVRRPPPPPRLASLLCSVCHRPVDEGTLCPRHGGTRGLTVTLAGHTASMQVAAGLLAATSLVAVVVGLVMLVSHQPLGVVVLVAGAALLRVTMSLTQLRTWARWTATAVAAMLIVLMLVAAATQLSSSRTAAGFLLAGAAVSALIAACLWTPETHRAFRRIPG